MDLDSGLLEPFWPLVLPPTLCSHHAKFLIILSPPKFSPMMSGLCQFLFLKHASPSNECKYNISNISVKLSLATLRRVNFFSRNVSCFLVLFFFFLLTSALTFIIYLLNKKFFKNCTLQFLFQLLEYLVYLSLVFPDFRNAL